MPQASQRKVQRESGSRGRAGFHSGFGLAQFKLTIVLSLAADAALAGINVWTTSGPQSDQVSRPAYVVSLAIDPQNPLIMFAATSGDGLFKSADGGSSWVKTELQSRSVVGVVIYRQNSSIVYASSESGIWKSQDGGADWTLVGPTRPYSSPLIVDPRDSNTLFASAYLGGVWKSTDGGASWSAVLLPRALIDDVSPVAIHPQDPSILYAATGDGVFKTTDGGGTWRSVNTGMESTIARYQITAIAIDPHDSNTAYAGTLATVFKTTDGGARWSPLTSGLPGVFVLSLAVDPQNSKRIYAGTGYIWTGAGVFTSADGAMTWDPMNSGLAALWVNTLAIDPLDPRNLHAGTFDGGVFSIRLLPLPSRSRSTYR